MRKKQLQVALLALLFDNKNYLQVDFLKEHWREIIWLAERSDIKLPVFKKLCEFLKPAPSGLLYLYNKTEREFELFWSTAYEVQQFLYKNGVKTIIIKGVRKYKFYGWDINLLCWPQDWFRAIDILEKIGWHPLRRLPLTIENRLNRLWPERKFKEVLTKGNEQFFIHLHKAISWDGIIYIPNDLLWNSYMSQTVNGREYITPSYTLDMLIHYAHMLFENYEIRLGELYHFIKVMKSENIDFELMDESARNYGWSNGLELVRRTIANMSNPTIREKASFPYRFGIRDLVPVWLERAKFHLIKHKDISTCAHELLFQSTSYFNLRSIIRRVYSLGRKRIVKVT